MILKRNTKLYAKLLTVNIKECSWN